MEHFEDSLLFVDSSNTLRRLDNQMQLVELDASVEDFTVISVSNKPSIVVLFLSGILKIDSKKFDQRVPEHLAATCMQTIANNHFLVAAVDSDHTQKTIHYIIYSFTVNPERLDRPDAAR